MALDTQAMGSQPAARESADAEAIRAQICESALELFTRDGFANVTAASICAHAGVGPADFDAQFLSSYAVLKKLYEDITVEVINNVLAALDDAGPDLLEHLYAGMRAYLHTLLDDPRRALLVGIEVLGVDPRLDAIRRDARILFAEFFAQLAATYEDQGKLPRGRSNLSYMALSAAVFEMVVAYALMPEEVRPPFDSLLDEAVHFFKAVVATPML